MTIKPTDDDTQRLRDALNAVTNGIRTTFDRIAADLGLERCDTCGQTQHRTNPHRHTFWQRTVAALRGWR